MDAPRHAFAARLRDATFWPRFASLSRARAGPPVEAQMGGDFEYGQPAGRVGRGCERGSEM